VSTTRQCFASSRSWTHADVAVLIGTSKRNVVYASKGLQVIPRKTPLPFGFRIQRRSVSYGRLTCRFDFVSSACGSSLSEAHFSLLGPACTFGSISTPLSLISPHFLQTMFPASPRVPPTSRHDRTGFVPVQIFLETSYLQRVLFGFRIQSFVTAHPDLSRRLPLSHQIPYLV
jgi:hypothetical protein